MTKDYRETVIRAAFSWLKLHYLEMEMATKGPARTVVLAQALRDFNVVRETATCAKWMDTLPERTASGKDSRNKIV